MPSLYSALVASSLALAHSHQHHHHALPHMLPSRGNVLEAGSDASKPSAAYSVVSNATDSFATLAQPNSAALPLLTMSLQSSTGPISHPPHSHPVVSLEHCSSALPLLASQPAIACAPASLLCQCSASPEAPPRCALVNRASASSSPASAPAPAHHNDDDDDAPPAHPMLAAAESLNQERASGSASQKAISSESDPESEPEPAPREDTAPSASHAETALPSQRSSKSLSGENLAGASTAASSVSLIIALTALICTF
ncbi:hypothetical protein BROUX41_005220 [Berkeleyomyces rouxiae]|uniref:uncharacterized protein n=1 Tax=Berkeleyomyces rouxiae TaxID=2035830 RepID=UPI003B7EEAE0